MIVVLAQATSSSDTDYPVGEIHSSLIFIHESSSENAQDRAVKELEVAGWRDVRLLRIGEVDAEYIIGRVDTVRDAYEDAIRYGAAVIVYRDNDDEYVP